MIIEMYADVFQGHQRTSDVSTACIQIMVSNLNQTELRSRGHI